MIVPRTMTMAGHSMQASEAGFTVTLPPPPSVNTTWRHTRGGGHYISPAVRLWSRMFEAEVLRAGVVRIRGPVEIVITVVPGKGFKANRDLDNLFKVPIDALRKGELIDSDDIQTVQSVSARVTSRDDRHPDGCIRLSVTPVEPAQVIAVLAARKPRRQGNRRAGARSLGLHGGRAAETYD